MDFRICLDNESVASGECRVMIVLTHLGESVRIDSGVVCRLDCWDAERECVSDSYPFAAVKNEEIAASQRRLLGEVQKAIDDCILAFIRGKRMNSGNVAPASENPEAVHTDNTATFLDVIDSKISSVRTLNTRRGYEVLRRYFAEKFKDGGNVSDKSLGNQFMAQVAKDFRAKISAGNLMTARFLSVWNHGMENGLIKSAPPDFKRHTMMAMTDRNLPLEIMRKLYTLMKSKLTGCAGFEDKGAFALGLFFLDVAFQGLSPVDFARLKVGDLSFGSVLTENGERLEVVKISTYRQKTGRPVRIVSWKEPVSEILELFCKGKGDEDNLTDCFEKGKEYSDSQRQNRLCNFFNKMADHLNESVQNDRELSELLSGRRITYYYARHAFCNLVDSLDIPHNVIQMMIGHRISILERSYLRHIDEATQAAISHEIFCKLAINN